jgi:hypothetical protein
MEIMQPVKIENIDLSAVQLTNDEIHYIDAVNLLVLIVSMPQIELGIDNLNFLESLAALTLFEVISGKVPSCLLSVGAYSSLCLFAVYKKDGRVFLMLRSTAFCAVGSVDEIKEKISKQLEGLIYLELRQLVESEK